MHAQLLLEQKAYWQLQKALCCLGTARHATQASHLAPGCAHCSSSSAASCTPHPSGCLQVAVMKQQQEQASYSLSSAALPVLLSFADTTTTRLPVCCPCWLLRQMLLGLGVDVQARLRRCKLMLLVVWWVACILVCAVICTICEKSGMSKESLQSGSNNTTNAVQSLGSAWCVCLVCLVHVLTSAEVELLNSQVTAACYQCVSHPQPTDPCVLKTLRQWALSLA